MRGGEREREIERERGMHKRRRVREPTLFPTRSLARSPPPPFLIFFKEKKIGNRLTSPNGKDQALVKLKFSNLNSVGWNKKKKKSLTFKKLRFSDVETLMSTYHSIGSLVANSLEA